MRIGEVGTPSPRCFSLPLRQTLADQVLRDALDRLRFELVAFLELAGREFQHVGSEPRLHEIGAGLQDDADAFGGCCRVSQNMNRI